MTKRILLPFVMLLFIAQQSFSQNPAEHKDEIKEEVSAKGIDWAKDMTQKVDGICDLSQDQEKQIMAVNLRFADKLQELKEEKGLSAEDMQSRKEQILRTVYEDYGPILTSEQKDKLKAHWDDVVKKA